MVLIDSILKNNKDLLSIQLDISKLDAVLQKETSNILYNFPFIFELNKYLLNLKKNISNNYLNLKDSFEINDYMFSFDKFSFNEKIKFNCKNKNNNKKYDFFVYNNYDCIYYYLLINDVCVYRFFINENNFIIIEYFRNDEFQFLKSNDNYVFQISDDFYSKYYNVIDFNPSGQVKYIIISEHFLSTYPNYPFIKINCFRNDKKNFYGDITYSLLSRDEQNYCDINDYQKLKNFGIDIFDIFNFNTTTDKILSMNTTL